MPPVEPVPAASPPDASPELTEPNDVGGAPPSVAKWNLYALTLDVVFFSLSLAFFDMTTIMPQLMEKLGASGTLIGYFATVRSLAFNAIQIFIAYAMHNRIRQKPLLAWAATVMRLPLLILPFFIYRAGMGENERLIAMLATIVFATIWAFGDGLGYVPWMEIVVRSFSDRTRGRFFASTQSFSGAVTIFIAAFMISPILNRFPFPVNYALLAIIWAIFMQISLVGVLLIKEPPAPTYLQRGEAPPRPRIGAYLKHLPGLLRKNPVVFRVCIIQLLLGFGSASQPFYILYAKQRFDLPDYWAGWYLVFQAVGALALMPLWAILAERRNSTFAVKSIAIACLLTPLLALTLGRQSPWLFGGVFFLLGGTLGWGMWIVLNQFMLTQVSESDRPIFIALINLIFAPAAFYPAIGGLLVPDAQLTHIAGVPVLFVLTALVISVGCLLTRTLPTPQAQS